MDLLKIFEEGNYSQVVNQWSNDDIPASSDPNAAYIAAAAYFRLGDLEKACGLCELIEGPFENNAEFLAMYAAILRRLNLYSRAEEIFQHALKLNPNSKEVKNNYTNLLIDQNKYDEAIAILREIIKEYPEYLDAKNNLNRAESIQAEAFNISVRTGSVKAQTKGNLLGDPLDKAFKVEEVVKCGAKVGTLSAAVNQILSDPNEGKIQQAELEMLKLASDHIKNNQYYGALDILQKIRLRAGLYASTYKVSSDALIGLEKFKDAEIHALIAHISGEVSIANCLNLASLAAMRKDQLMAQKWINLATSIDKHNDLVVQSKSMLFPNGKSRDVDSPFKMN